MTVSNCAPMCQLGMTTCVKLLVAWQLVAPHEHHGNYVLLSKLMMLAKVSDFGGQFATAFFLCIPQSLWLLKIGIQSSKLQAPLFNINFCNNFGLKIYIEYIIKTQMRCHSI